MLIKMYRAVLFSSFSFFIILKSLAAHEAIIMNQRPTVLEDKNEIQILTSIFILSSHFTSLRHSAIIQLSLTRKFPSLVNLNRIVATLNLLEKFLIGLSLFALSDKTADNFIFVLKNRKKRFASPLFLAYDVVSLSWRQHTQSRAERS